MFSGGHSSTEVDSGTASIRSLEMAVMDWLTRSGHTPLVIFRPNSSNGGISFSHTEQVKVPVLGNWSRTNGGKGDSARAHLPLHLQSRDRSRDLTNFSFTRQIKVLVKWLILL